MKVLILCAGLGTRLGNLTEKIPKCLVKLNSKSILERLLDQLSINGLQKNQIYFGAGYKSEELPRGYKKFINFKFKITNMMETTIIGIKGLLKDLQKKENLLIVYGDCIYSDSFIKEVIPKVDKITNITVPVDLDWEIKWSKRYQNIYQDAETLQYDLFNERLLSIGEKTSLKKDYMAQFMGIYFLPQHFIKKYINSYESMPINIRDKISTTEFFQKTKNINTFYVMPGKYSWTEVDTLDDLLYAKKNFL